MDKLLNANRALWDELTHINAASQLYDLAGFKAGQTSLHKPDLDELGPVAGKTLLHLQCHFGQDTLSWARLGAQVTGADFSGEAIGLARRLGAACGLPARFIQSNLYDLPAVLDERFDIVYTSYGVLTWLPDLRRWAQIAAGYLKPGGVFYIAEFHPFMMVFDDHAVPPRVDYPYFHSEPLEFPTDVPYADHSARVSQPVSYEWAYTLSDIISNLIDAGLRIQFLHEFDYVGYEMYPFMVRGEDGFWRLPPEIPSLPLMFSIRAVKEQA